MPPPPAYVPPVKEYHQPPPIKDFNLAPSPGPSNPYASNKQLPVKPLHSIDPYASLGGGTLMGQSEYLPLDPNHRHSTNFKDNPNPF